MSKRIACLLFVLTTTGCHPTQEGAVCPAPEEEVSEPEATSEERVPVEMTPELEAEIKKAKRRAREAAHRWY